MPSASIVIPVFNRAHLVERAIESALAQTVPCEVLLVDHGSTDAIYDVAARYEGRLRYIRRQRDQGPVACWIDGIGEAAGEYVHITYDDDWIEPRFMETCLDAFGSDTAFVYTRVKLHQMASQRSELSVLHPAGNLPVGPLVQHLLRRPFSLSPGCAVFRRRDALDNLLPEVPGAAGQFGGKSGVGEDLLLFLLTTLRYPRYVHIGEPLADFLAHPGSITIGAVEAGQGRPLADAYELAKSYYLSKPGAAPRERGAARIVSAARWLVGSGEVPTYLAKAVNKLRQLFS